MGNAWQNMERIGDQEGSKNSNEVLSWGEGKEKGSERHEERMLRSERGKRKSWERQGGVSEQANPRAKVERGRGLKGVNKGG